MDTGKNFERWREITTFEQVVEACGDDSYLRSEYMTCNPDSSYCHQLNYTMVRYAIDRGCRLNPHARWYTPTLMLLTERQERFGDPVGLVTGYGEEYCVYPGEPECVGAQAVSTGHSLLYVRFPVTYNQLAVTSTDKARHISRYFARELFLAIYGELDYEWEDVR